MAKRTVIPGCDIEGRILENARIAKKAHDPKYTQKYVAGLVDKDQNYWTQWRQGTTRILDKYWLTFAHELGFDPFETRPYLHESKRALDEAFRRSTGKASPGGAPKSMEEMFLAIPEEDALRLLKTLGKTLGVKDASRLAAYFAARVQKLLEEDGA